MPSLDCLRCRQLCRASDNLCGEAGALLPELVEEPSVDSTLADIRSCVEDTQEMVHTMDGLAPPKTGGGGGCCGGSKGGKNMVAVAPAPLATVDGLLSKDVELAALRGALRRVLGDARRAVRAHVLLPVLSSLSSPTASPLSRLGFACHAPFSRHSRAMFAPFSLLLRAGAGAPEARWLHVDDRRVLEGSRRGWRQRLHRDHPRRYAYGGWIGNSKHRNER